MRLTTNARTAITLAITINRTYMIRRLTFILLASITLLLVAAHGAAFAASSPASIHRDAADGRIDGDYTVAELRAADRSAPVELVEYGGWPDMYQDALQRKTDPSGKKTPAPYVPQDKNKNGTIDPTEQAEADKKNKAAGIPTSRAGGPTARSCDDEAEGDDCVVPNEDIIGDDTAGGDDEVNDGSGDNSSLLLWLIVGLPIVIVAFGAWRMMRKTKAPKSGSAPTAASVYKSSAHSSYATPVDDKPKKGAGKPKGDSKGDGRSRRNDRGAE